MSSDLNPMQLWRYVMEAKPHTQPVILIACHSESLKPPIMKILTQTWTCFPRFIIEVSAIADFPSNSFLNNMVEIRLPLNSMERQKDWKKIDYILGGDFEQEALLAGVTVLKNPKKLEEVLSRTWAFDRLRRIENFEQGKLLTTP